MIGIYKLFFQTLPESLKNYPFLQPAERLQWAVFTGKRDLSICCLNIKSLNAPSRKLSTLQKSQVSNVSFWHKSRSILLFINRLSKAPISTKRKACQVIGLLGGLYILAQFCEKRQKSIVYSVCLGTRWCQLALGRVVVMDRCAFVFVCVCGVYMQVCIHVQICMGTRVYDFMCTCVILCVWRLETDIKCLPQSLHFIYITALCMHVNIMSVCM